MIETPTTPTAVPADKKKRKARVKSTTPRVIDPEIKALRQEHLARVASLMNTRRSAGILKTILEKRLAQLTPEDKNKLADALRTVTTPAMEFPESDGKKIESLQTAS